MALPAAQPRYLACSQLNDGKAEAVNVKAWVYTKADGEPLVLLELRRLLHSCGKIARKEYVNDVVAKGCNPEGEWQNCFGLFGLTADECLVKSHKAKKYKNKHLSGVQIPGIHRNEWQISVLGALVLMCQWSMSGMHRSQKRSAFFMRSMLEAAVPLDSMGTVLSLFRDADLLQRCMQRSGLKPCVHLSSLLCQLPTVSAGTTAGTFMEQILGCLTKTWATADECDSARQISMRVLDNMAVLLEQHFVEFGHCDVLMGSSLDPARDRRLRVDEDVVEFLRQQAAEQNLSRRVLTSVHDAAHPTAVTGWQMRDACRYAASSWLTFQEDITQNVVVSVSLDGKRLGDPGQDLLVGAASRGDIAVWLPPQASRLRFFYFPNVLE